MMGCVFGLAQRAPRAHRSASCSLARGGECAKRSRRSVFTSWEAWPPREAVNGWNDLTEIDDGAGEIWPLHHCPPQQRLWWIYAMASYHGRQLTSNLWGTDNPRCVSSWAYLIYQFRQCLSKAEFPEDFSVVIHTMGMGTRGFDSPKLFLFYTIWEEIFGKRNANQLPIFDYIFAPYFHWIFFAEPLVCNYTDLGCKCLKPNKTSSYEWYDHALHISDSLTRTNSFIHDSDFTFHAVYFWFAKKIQLIRLFYLAKGPLWLFFVASYIFSSDTIWSILVQCYICISGRIMYGQVPLTQPNINWWSHKGPRAEIMWKE